MHSLETPWERSKSPSCPDFFLDLVPISQLLLGARMRLEARDHGAIVSPMVTFLMLSTVGPEGASTLSENPDRLKGVNAEVEAMGVRVVDQWALLGPYDFCTILEAPDEGTMARVALILGARGTLKTLTLVAIPIDEYIESVRGATN
jgi:uncharacterized protein with GYD domain